MTENAPAFAKGGPCKSYAAIENDILEMFAPAHQNFTQIVEHSRSDKALWRADAVHRARNLSQLTLSLANLAEHPSRCWLPNGLVTEARRLARAYAELSEAVGQSRTVPCAPLLVEITTRLALIFGGARGITLSVDAEFVMLAPDMRRVLILICSELVINALKYAYPGDAGGAIRVVLTARHGEILLVVEDDGVGLEAEISPGKGAKLVDGLAAVCCASVSRDSGHGGSGCRVAVTMPAMMALALQA